MRTRRSLRGEQGRGWVMGARNMRGGLPKRSQVGESPCLWCGALCVLAQRLPLHLDTHMRSRPAALPAAFLTHHRRAA